MSDVDVIATLETCKVDLANSVGLSIIGSRDYFDNYDGEVSAKLRELQEFIGGLVREHDNLADHVDPTRRLVGKRGRPAEVKTPTTAEDVISRLAKK